MPFVRETVLLRAGRLLSLFVFRCCALNRENIFLSCEMFFPIQEVKLHIGSWLPFFGTLRVMLFQNPRTIPEG